MRISRAANQLIVGIDDCGVHAMVRLDRIATRYHDVEVVYAHEPNNALG
jgi:hypothetical protein